MILAISTVVFAVSLCQKYNITINNLLLATGGGPWSW
jgi:predicted nuclease with TOPRIM domain